MRTCRQHVARLEQLIDRVQKRVGAEDITLREADKMARDLRSAIEAPPMLPHIDRDALEDIIEPYLIQQGFLQRTPRGRLLTPQAFGHLGLAVPASRANLNQLDLLSDDEAGQ